MSAFAVVLADLAAGFEQEPAHASGPGVAVGVLDEGEVAQQMGAAQGVLAVPVGEVAGPAIVDQDASVAGDDIEVVDGGPAALAVDELQRQVPGADGVQPVVFPVDAQAGLVSVQGGHGEQALDRGGLPVRPARGAVELARPARSPRRPRARSGP